MIKFINAEIQGVLVRDLTIYRDSRGWLCELFRKDDAPPDVLPAMCYVSVTKPSVVRGPHEHVDQADWFCFVGPSRFQLVLWDNRHHSSTFRHRMSMIVGEGNPASIIVPAGVVHGYKNVGSCDGWVMNFPDRLYKGAGKQDKVDEIRHELDPDSPFRMDAC